MILKELWTKENADTEVKSTFQYVLDLKEKLEDTCSLAQLNLIEAGKAQRKYYNRKPRIDR